VPFFVAPPHHRQRDPNLLPRFVALGRRSALWSSCVGAPGCRAAGGPMPVVARWAGGLRGGARRRRGGGPAGRAGRLVSTPAAGGCGGARRSRHGPSRAVSARRDDDTTNGRCRATRARCEAWPAPYSDRVVTTQVGRAGARRSPRAPAGMRYPAMRRDRQTDATPNDACVSTRAHPASRAMTHVEDALR
jgi:hypothetical protein